MPLIYTHLLNTSSLYSSPVPTVYSTHLSDTFAISTSPTFSRNAPLQCLISTHRSNASYLRTAPIPPFQAPLQLLPPFIIKFPAPIINALYLPLSCITPATILAFLILTILKGIMSQDFFLIRHLGS